MRIALITILLVVPLTAVLTAGATAFALRIMQDAEPLPVLTPTPAPNIAPAPAPSPMPMPEPEPEPEHSHEPLPRATLVATPVVEIAPATTADGATPEPARPDRQSTPTIGAVDYLRLNEDLQDVSTTLDRFNRKLLEALGAVEEPSGDGGADRGGGDHATAVALDERKVPE